MKRLHYTLAFAAALAVPCAFSQTWDLGKDGTVKQTQTANTKNANKQSAGEQASSKATAKTSNSDADLKQQVNQKFGTDAALRYILVEVQNGNVTLSGTVPSKADRKRAVHLAKLVPGVHKVHDSLTVDANASSSGDNEPTNAHNIPPKPKTTAAARPRMKPGSVSRPATQNEKAVASSDPANENPATGEAHLGTSAGVGGGISGAAASASLSANSNSAAADPGGVTRSTGTTTDFSAVPVPLMRPLANTTTLKGQIENALRNDAQVGSSKLNVNVTDTTIELSGNVPTGKERTAAYRIVQSFAFNRRVQDRMTVTGRGNAGPVPGANPGQPSGNVDSAKPAVGNAATPNIPKSKAAADGNAFNPR